MGLMQSPRVAPAVFPAHRPKGLVLVVDDVTTNVRLLRRFLSLDGYAVVGGVDGAEAVELAVATNPDLVLMDVRMPGCDGFTACRMLKDRPETKLTPVILMTGADECSDRLQAIESGADDFITKPVNRAELRARVRSLVRLKHYTDDLDSAASMILSLGLTVEARSPYTYGHCQRLSAYGVSLGRRLGLSDEELDALDKGGYLHDVGKIGIPDALLLKTGPLTTAEEEEMRMHTLIGDRLCGNLRVLRHVRPIIRHHHERLDGSGYPDGLRGSEVPLLAQVISIVDAFDAMTTDRSYRAAVSRECALAILCEDVRRGLRDPLLVEAWTAAVRGGDLARIDGLEGEIV